MIIPTLDAVDVARRHVEENNFNIELVMKIETEVFGIELDPGYDSFERFIAKYSIFYCIMGNGIKTNTRTYMYG